MPVMDTAHIGWSCIGDTTSQKIIFDYFVRVLQTWTIAELKLSNTTYQLEPEALAISPNLLPVGPLMETYQKGSWGQFWQEDFSCLDWLNQQPPHSVIYVAFGSFTVFDPIQFQELALGLELTGKPFLWVVRPGTDNSVSHPYPDEFTGTRGKIVRWAPQQQVLSHPALACFITHCGWNSTLEGVCNGVPCLCWPYFADQFFDKTYICDVWKVGFGFDTDERGIISREEIKMKVEQLVSVENLRARSSKLKEMAMNNIAEGGQSSENFRKFMKWLKE
ncbi:UDP-glycosyltransferase [Quillaja saponaria]|uniref:UDP-glycosyltransferase n=1 Tax=Quillaja saponaria TaxID=32244 RepID=A0AAD7Q3V0_QUISA|nr:UDP-glycosyltransferase [Quillaja saponaria]